VCERDTGVFELRGGREMEREGERESKRGGEVGRGKESTKIGEVKKRRRRKWKREIGRRGRNSKRGDEEDGS